MSREIGIVGEGLYKCVNVSGGSKWFILGNTYGCFYYRGTLAIETEFGLKPVVLIWSQFVPSTGQTLEDLL